MQLIVMRHGATEFNAKRLINSRIDEPLSEAGKLQLPELLESVQQYSFEAMYASPLKRTVQTATPIAESRQLEIQLDDRLMEVDCGSFAGQDYDSTIPHYGLNSSDLLSTYAYDMSEFGGETSDQVEARVRDFLDDLKAQSYTSVLVVTHGGIIRMFNFVCTGEKIGVTQNGAALAFNI